MLEQRALPTTITDLGVPLTGATGITPTAINASGQVVGRFLNSSGLQRAFLYSQGQMIDIGSPVPNTPTSAVGISAAGQVAVTVTPDIQHPSAYVYSQGSFVPLPQFPETTGMYADSMNASGQVVGGSRGFSHQPGFIYSYSDGSLTDLGSLYSDPSQTIGEAVSDTGQVVGISVDLVNGSQGAFTYRGSISGLNIGGHPQFYGVNTSGQIVGGQGDTNTVFLYDSGYTFDLGHSNNGLIGINNSGRCVLAHLGHATLYSQGVFLDLNSLLPPNSGWTLNGATAINDSGEIVGTGSHDGQARAFLLDLSPLWLGQGTDNLWSDGGNWLSDRAPTAGADLIFPPGVQRLNNVDDLGFAFHSISVGDHYSFSGQALTVTGDLAVQQGASLEVDNSTTVNGSTTIAASTVLSVGGGATLDLGGMVTAEAGSTLRVQQNATLVDRGAMTVAATGMLDDQGTVTVAATGMLDDQGTLSLSGAMVLDGSLTSGGTTTFSSGTVSGNGTLTTTGPFTQSDGDLGGSVNVMVSGPFTWTGGTMYGTGSTTVTSQGSLTVSSGGRTPPPTVNRDLHVLGHAALDSLLQIGTDRLVDFADVTMDNSGSVNIGAGADVEVGDASFTGGGVNLGSAASLTFGGTMQGTTISAAANANVSVQYGTITNATFNLDATANLNLGYTGQTLAINGTTTASGTTHLTSGMVDISGAFMTSTFQEGGGSLSGSGTLTSSGAFTLSGGDLGGAVNLNASGGLTWSGGTMDGTGTTNVTSAGQLAINGTGNMTLDRTLVSQVNGLLSAGTLTGNGSLRSTALFTQSGGALSGALGLAAQGGLTWTGGIMDGTGTTTVGANAQLSVSGAGKTLNRILQALAMGNANFATGTTIDLGSHARLDLAGTANIQGTTFTAAAGATLNLTGTGTIADTTFNLAAMANMKIASNGTWNVTGTTVFTGSGTVHFASGTLNITGNLSASKLHLAGGTVSGSGDLTIISKLVWSNGAMTGTGTTTISANAVLTGRAGTQSLSRPLKVAGNTDGRFNLTITNATWEILVGGNWHANGSNINGTNGTFQVDAGATAHFGKGKYNIGLGVQVTDDGRVIMDGNAKVKVFHFLNDLNLSLDGHVQATLDDYRGSGRTQASGYASLLLQNSDLSTSIGFRFKDHSNGHFEDTTFGPVPFKASPKVEIFIEKTIGPERDPPIIISGAFADAGTLDIGSEETVIFQDHARVGKLTNAGTVQIASGDSLKVHGKYVQSDGATMLSGGTLTAKHIDIEGGALMGPGTINGKVQNGGEVDVMGELDITGDYNQTATGTLNLNINGPGTAGIDYDLLAVSGAVTLDGTVNLNFQYPAAANDNFTPLTGGSVTGAFATVNARNLDASLQVMTAYDPGDVTFTLVPSMDTRSSGLNAAPADAENAEQATDSGRNQAAGAPESAVTAESFAYADRMDSYFTSLAARAQPAEDLMTPES
jgi:probable HAF family extracellular repeat protein